jgi:hypothetical protein
MKISHLLTALLSILLISTSQAKRMTFYVSTTGDDVNPGSQGLPWRTIQHAMNTVTAGSTVNIMAGTYHERLTLNVSGAASSPIIFQPNGYTGLAADGTPAGASIAYNGYKTPVGDSVILDYTYLGTVTDNIPFLNISNRRSYVTIQGLTFQNFTGMAKPACGLRIDGGSNNIQIINCRFLNNKNIGDFTLDYRLEHIRLWNCNHCSLTGNEMGYIRAAESENCTFDTVNSVNNSAISNYVHDIDATAFDIHGGANNCLLRANLIEYSSLKRDGMVWDNSYANAIYVDGGNRSIIERNLVRHSGLAIAVLVESNQLPAHRCHDIIVRDNIVHDNKVLGLMAGVWYSDTDGSAVYNITFTNNTSARNLQGIRIRPYTNATVKWENNILYQNATGVADDNNWPIGTIDYDLYFGNTAGPEAHPVLADPLFTNPTGTPPDWSLKTGSPAINTGDPSFVAGAGETDFAGNLRVVGGRVDIGAHGSARSMKRPAKRP